MLVCLSVLCILYCFDRVGVLHWGQSFAKTILKWPCSTNTEVVTESAHVPVV